MTLGLISMNFKIWTVILRQVSTGVIRYWSQNTTSDFQMGKGRTTTGMILACLIKDILFGESDKTYFKESDMVNPKDYSDEDEVAEEVVCQPLGKS